MPSRLAGLYRIDDDSHADVVDNERGTDIEPIIELTFQKQQLAMQQRTIELLEQSLEATVGANRRADAERGNARRSNRLNVAFLIAGLLIAIIGIVFGVLVSG